MVIALVPHTQKLPAEVHLRTLHPQLRSTFDDLMDQADAIDTPSDWPLYQHLHADAAHIIGIQLPADGELARCDCGHCTCDIVCAARYVRSYLDGTVWRTQCPACTDDHYLDGE
ncbi:hypothetical protein [Streptomyces sp. 8L]|uniref:hypothetical protein n=1 Tax=Streptomyces sp. 8L TaxID=2877242 RepID=UPI001CD670B7|nr:hypothetical protein [Streptomyces sp. 8L]MCA1224117.1 hypothetical protein [Streptomyces sp. 8L]